MSYNNQQETTPAKKHKCKFCNYTSDQSNNVTRHALKKHPEMNNTNVQSYASPMGIENAGVVYQQNYREVQPPPSYQQHALPGPATVNQFNIPPHQQPVNQPNAQSVYHQTGYLSDVGTQTSDEEEEEEPDDILELLKNTETNFNDLQAIKKQYLAALPKVRKLGDKDLKKFLKRYARFKVRLMNHYKVIESDQDIIKCL